MSKFNDGLSGLISCSSSNTGVGSSCWHIAETIALRRESRAGDEGSIVFGMDGFEENLAFCESPSRVPSRVRLPFGRADCALVGLGMPLVAGGEIRFTTPCAWWPAGNAAVAGCNTGMDGSVRARFVGEGWSVSSIL